MRNTQFWFPTPARECRPRAPAVAKGRIKAVKPQTGAIASARALPRIRFGFVGQAFDRSFVGSVVSLGLLRIGLIRLLLMFVPAAHVATNALRLSADRRRADGECKKHNCRCAAFHVRVYNPRPTIASSGPIRTVD